MDMYDIAVTQSARGALYDFFDVDIADVDTWMPQLAKASKNTGKDEYIDVERGSLYRDDQISPLPLGAAFNAARNSRQAAMQHRRNVMQLDMEFCTDYFIFQSYDGVLMRPNTLTHRFHKIVKEHDLPPVHLHSLRHTMATLLIDQSLPLTAITASLGHSSPHTTALIYAHALQQNAAKAAEAMDLILQ